MIPRYQRVLFWALTIASLLMALFLLRGCEQAHKRLTAPLDATPIAPPVTAVSEDITLYVANDLEGSITPVSRQLSLPADPTTRARVLLDDLLAGYAQSGSTHPLPAGPSVTDVFLLDLPLAASSGKQQPTSSMKSSTESPDAYLNPSGQLAVVNLHSSFADTHPSGVQAETLTLQSIVGTLHASFPKITEVRFLVDGQPRETLAGHADLLRVYPVVDTSFTPTTPVEDRTAP